MTWNEVATKSRIQKAWSDLEKIAVTRLTREVSLDGLALKEAYLVDGVHVYFDIPNARSLIDGDSEAEQRKFLRFLNIFMRVVHLLFEATHATLVDLQNTRLHFVVYKPYDSEEARIHAAVAIAAVLRQVVLDANELHAELNDAKIVVGIESGSTLAVRNGTRGDREPLFLGNAANLAAKVAGSGAGIYLGNRARKVLGISEAAGRDGLDQEKIAECILAAELSVNSSQVLDKWKQEQAKHPISEVAFSRWTPPLKGVNLDELTPRNSRRMDCVFLLADIDGFTSYVHHAIQGGEVASAVRLLHVIRKELRDVLNDFGGRKLRYVGDCVQGLLAEGTAHNSDAEATVRTAALCAAAMRSSFHVIQYVVPEASSLGLQIGFEYGPVAVSGLGVRTSRQRCAVGQTVLVAEDEQLRCGGHETAIGEVAASHAPEDLKEAFGRSRKSASIDYERLALRLGHRDGHKADCHGSSGRGPIRPRAYGH